MTIWMLILAYLHAKQETEIEGKAGWARHLPTFRINVFITKLLIGKEITGYHIYMLLMFLIIFHLPLLFIPFTWKNECIVMGLISVYWVIEDFLFFIVNPHFTLKNFCKSKICWHKRWCLWNLMPVSYIWGIIVGSILLILGR
jgi:hypothetical protein